MTPPSGDVATERKARGVITLTTVAVLVVLWALFALWAYNLQVDRRQAMEKVLDRQRGTVSEQVGGVFRTAEIFLALVNRWVQEHSDTDPCTDPGFARMVRDFQRVTGNAMFFRLADADGTLHLVPDPSASKPANIADRDYFKATLAAPPGQVVVSPPFVGRSSGHRSVAVATRLSSPSHGVVVAFVAIVLDSLESAFAEARVDENSAISLLRRDGILIVRSGPGAVEPGRDLSQSAIFVDGLSKASQGVVFNDARLTDGIPKLSAYGLVPGYPLVVSVGRPLSVLRAETHGPTLRAAAIMVLVSLAAVASCVKILGLLDDLAAGRSQVVESRDRLGAQIAERSRVEMALKRSEADLRTILDNMVDVFYRTGRDGTVTMISPSVETVFGYLPAEVLGRPATDFHADPAARERLMAALRESGGKVRDHEFMMRRKGGDLSWVSTSSHLVWDESGEVAGIEGVIRPMDERKAAEKALRDQIALTQSLINASSDATMLFTQDGTLLAVNSVLANRVGRTPEQLQGTNLWDLFPPEVMALRKRTCDQVLATGEATHLLDQRGDLYFDNSIYPVAGEGGYFDRLAVFSRDITEQKRTEARLSRYIAEIERSNAELEQFAYVASHDLREPLRMISSYLSLIERRYKAQLAGEGLEFLDFARDGARRMDQLVLDLLDYSRIDRRGSPIVAMDARSALLVAIRHLSVALAENSGVVTLPEGDGGPSVMGDQDQIIRLFQNLIGNAVKYRDPTRPPEVRVGWSLSDGVWEFVVSDNGIGIDRQYFDRIFGIFQRLHTRDKFDGTGIGLAICKKIVERHGGRIWLESEPGVGSRFHFTLTAAGEGISPSSEVAE